MSRSTCWIALLVLVICAPTAAAQEKPSLERARAMYDAGNLDSARQELEGLVRGGTQDPAVFLLLGVVERTAGRLGSAIASLEKARTIAPDVASIGVELATTLAWNRKLDPAIVLLKSVLAADPGNAGAQSGLGFALAWQGHFDEAREIFAAMIEVESHSVPAWTGLGFVERASLHRDEAISAYRQVLTAAPGNVEAIAALEELRWDRRGDVRALAGVSEHPGVSALGEAQINASYALSPRLGISGGYQRYAYGAASPLTGGGILVGTSTEDSVEAGVVFRPSLRTTLGASLYTFFGADATRGIVWIEGVRAITSRLSLLANVRPALSENDPRWLFAWALGGSVSVAPHHQLTARALVASDTNYEPGLTAMVSYEGAPARWLALRLAVAKASGDGRFEFTSVSAGATYLFVPQVGLSAQATRRVGTAERSTLSIGLVLRR